MSISSIGPLSSCQSIIGAIEEVDADEPSNKPFQYVYLRRTERDFTNYACDG